MQRNSGVYDASKIIQNANTPHPIFNEMMRGARVWIDDLHQLRVNNISAMKMARIAASGNLRELANALGYYRPITDKDAAHYVELVGRNAYSHMHQLELKTLKATKCRPDLAKDRFNDDTLKDIAEINRRIRVKLGPNFTLLGIPVNPYIDRIVEYLQEQSLGLWMIKPNGSRVRVPNHTCFRRDPPGTLPYADSLKWHNPISTLTGILNRPDEHDYRTLSLRLDVHIDSSLPQHLRKNFGTNFNHIYDYMATREMGIPSPDPCNMQHPGSGRKATTCVMWDPTASPDSLEYLESKFIPVNHNLVCIKYKPSILATIIAIIEEIGSDIIEGILTRNSFGSQLLSFLGFILRIVIYSNIITVFFMIYLNYNETYKIMGLPYIDV